MKPLLRFIPSGARIVLVILVAIVLPSVLLSIFAIWAIGSERGHVQDRIRRDAHAMTRKVVETTFSTLSSAATKIAGQAAGLDGRDAPELAGELTVELRSLYPYFSQLVLVDKNGAPLYPVVPRSEMMIDLAPERSELRDALGKAQNFEFVQADLDAATRAYRETFEAAANPRLKVSALLGLARISAKQEKWVQAVESYRSALKAYGSEREKNGLLVGPAAALRIAQIGAANSSPREFAKRITSAHEELVRHRGQLTREEADFLDAQLVGLIGDFIRKDTADREQTGELRRVLDEIAAMRRQESLAEGVAAEAVRSRPFSLFEKGGIISYRHGGEDFVLVAVPVEAGGAHVVACTLAPVLDVERSLVVPEVGRLGTREEIALVVTHSVRGVVAGIAPEANSFRLGATQFPEPLSNLRAEAYLKGYESLTALSDIRTNIYVWAVGLAISGIVAGAVVTYVSVSRTMRAAELKSDFVSNVTHELKTPLTSIRMFAETLQQGRVQDEYDTRECLGTIVAESERLSRLIDKVLELGAIEKGKRKFDFSMADLREIILGCLQTFRRQMRGCEATVYVNIPNNLPRVRMDPDAVGEVLLNLLTNAYKYSPPEDRRIWVVARTDAGVVRVSVEDRGIGIPKRELKAIFEKFYRVDDLLTREVDGTGLGLTISRHVAQAHGGAIEVESKEGRGSKFTLVLPLTV